MSAFLSALTEVPEGYAVVLVSHAGLNDKNEIDRSVKDIVGALDAVRDRSSYRYGGKTYRYSDLKNVTAVCVLSGHQHRDGAVITQTGLPVISTACDAWRAAASADEQTRVRGTITEQAFDVMRLDTDSSTLTCKRIGSGVDRIFHYGFDAVQGQITLTPTLSGPLTWESSNPKRAIVSEGTVQKTGEGIVSIRATDENGNL